LPIRRSSPLLDPSVVWRRKRVEQDDSRGLLTLPDRKIFAQAPGNREFAINDWERRYYRFEWSSLPRD